MDSRTALFRAFNPNQVLTANDPRNVDCDSGRMGGVAPILAEGFTLADPEKPLHRMFTGHLGVGKSTELQKLIRILAQQGQTDVIYFDISDHLDGRTHDFRLSDLDILIADRVFDHFKGSTVSLGNTFIDDFKDRFRRIMESELALKSVEIAPALKAFDSLELGLGKIVTEIKSGPDSSRQILRKAISETRSSLRSGLNDILRSARIQLRKNVLIIVDGVEKIPSDRHEEIFIKGAEQLVDIDAHVLFTIPMQLTYHPQFNEMRMAFAQDPKTMPMIHKDTDEGMACLRKILETRCLFAGITLEDAFESEELITTLCRQSGGHVRQLLMFVQAAMLQGPELPISTGALEDAFRDYRIGVARQISSELWPWLRHFRDGSLRCMPEGIPDAIRRSLVNQLLVFEYINGESTYDVAPEIRKLAAFHEGLPA